MRRIVYAITLCLCAGWLGFTASSSARRSDERVAATYEQTLRSLSTINARLHAELLKVRSGISPSYDAVFESAAARQRTYNALRQFPSFVTGRAESELRFQLDEADRRQTDARGALERFKVENTVLRSSLQSLPGLAFALEAAVRSNERSTRATLLIRDLLLLQIWHDPALVTRIGTELGDLRKLSAGAPESERAQLTDVLTHAQLVYDRTPLVHELTDKILMLAAEAGVQAMLSAFTRSRDAAAVRARSDANTRDTLAIALLLAAAASLALRLQHDASLRRRIGSELDQAAASLELERAKQKELSDLKSTFISTVSSQFRTPLSVIMSSTEMLESYSDRLSEETKQEHIGRVRYEALELSRMLDAILTIGSHERGLLKFEPRPLEIDPFCGDVLAAVADATGQRNRVVFHGTGRKDPVLADPTLLRHMLENLLTNALKYSAAGTDVELNVERVEDELRFEVTDHGVGIDRDDLRHLFESFYRGRNVGTVAGTGLGLSIVRGAVELHGGQVAVRSQPDVGTSFMISIPCIPMQA